MKSNVDSSSTISDEVRVHPTAHIGPNCHIAGKVTVGAEARLVGGLTLIGNMDIGRHAILEPGVCVATLDPRSRDQRHVRVGEGAHIGAGSVLGGGISVGHGAWVGPGTVVSRHVPPHAIISGNPASITGYLNDQSSGGAASLAPKLVSTNGPPEVLPCAVPGVTLHRFRHVRDLRGDLTAGEFERNVPFRAKRYFVVFDVPSTETRGEHAHKLCDQFLICVAGSVSVVVDDGNRREEILLDHPTLGLFIPAGIWGVQYKYSANGTLLVFASEYYDASDYIRDYDEFLRFRKVVV